MREIRDRRLGSAFADALLRVLDHRRRDLKCSASCVAACAVTFLPWAVAAQTQPKSTPSTGIQAPPATSAAPTKPSPPATGTPMTAAKTMQIKRTVSGDLAFRFITSTDQSAPPTALPAATGTEGIVALALPAGLKVSDARLEVIDSSKGKVARLPASTSGVTPLTPADFTLIQTVLVPVQIRNKGALTGATVTLADAARKDSRTWLLKPTDSGTAQFTNVPQGVPITVTVSEGSATPVSQTQTLPADPPADGYRWPTITVDWPDAKTVPLPAASAAAAAPAAVPAAAVPPVAPPAPDPLGSILQFVVSLLFLGGAGYGLLWAYRNGHLKKLLDNLGIQTQPPTAADGPQGSPFGKAQRAPIQPITEGTAEPLAGDSFSMGAGSIAGVTGMPPIPGGGPRLVATMGSYAGHIFPVAPGAMDIGRDAANGVPLPQDTNTSRRHATLQALNGQITVTDNGSSNGTFVNGVKIPSQIPQPLRPGDELQIGMTRFRFEA